MGEDIFDTSLDNDHKCKIMATWGGGYSNKKDVVIDFEVDPSLCNNLLYKSNNADVVVMPTNYYELASNKIVIPAGAVSGGVEVKLTDAFFADPNALQRNYVIPLVMKSVVNADSILRGKSDLATPNRCVSGDWNIVPKDYILYAIKYINTWDGYYLRRGTDVVATTGGATQTSVRHQKYVESDEVCKLNTASLSRTLFPLNVKDQSGNNIPVSLILDFDANGQCSISSGTANITATGSGKFVKKGEVKSWGNKDRDALYLDYNVVVGARTYSTKDTLVARDRGVAKETFEVVLK
jgi:hypothetical protein